MNETTWLAALLLGLAGGGHCAGMCGGIVGALSRSAGSAGAASHRLACMLAYHGGRALSYALAGGIVGALGAAGLGLRGSAIAQQATFTFASIVLVATGVYLAGYAPFVHRVEAFGHVVWRRIEPWSRALLPVTTARRAFALGVAWGWLPCGMVYGALLLALTSGSVVSAALTMLAFAVGTLPSLMAVGLLAHSALRRPIGRTMRRMAAAAIIVAGLYGLAHANLQGSLVLDWCKFG